jgi:hypothetical protein
VLARILGAFLISLLASSASAQPPRLVRFSYALDDGVELCPDEAKLRAGVTARLGYDPFSATAEEGLQVGLHRSGRELEARITMSDGQGQVRAERRLVSRQGDCTELASSVELAVSIAIDPFRVSAPPEPAPAPPMPPAPAPVVPPPPPAPSPLSGQAKAGAVVGQGTAPTRTLGFVLGGAARRGRWSLGLDAQANLPRNDSLREGTIRSYSLTGSLVPCVHIHDAAACALFTAGSLHAEGRDLTAARKITRLAVALGARLAYALPLFGRWSLLFHADVTTPMTYIELQVDHQNVWTTPPLAAALGIDLTINFP